VRITWTGVDDIVRHGEVWSPGPLETSVWVLPDEPRAGEGRAVCVGLDGRQTAVQAEWSRQEHQELVSANLPVAGCLPVPTARGGQLRARIAPNGGP
jgi:hypothetical protein